MCPSSTDMPHQMTINFITTGGVKGAAGQATPIDCYSAHSLELAKDVRQYKLCDQVYIKMILSIIFIKCQNFTHKISLHMNL